MADGSVTIDTRIDNSQFERGLRDMRRSADTWSRGTQADFQAVARSSAALEGSLSQLKSVLAGYVGFKVLGDIKNTAVEIASIRVAFESITGSSQGAAQEMAYVASEAQRLGLDMMALAGSFKGFSAAGKSAQMSSADVKDIFFSVSEAATVMGLSAEKTGRTMYALEQMLSKGTVSMEELRQQLGDQLPGAFTMAAKAMGVYDYASCRQIR